MVTMQVQPRPTAEERAEAGVDVEVDDRLSDLAGEIDDWATGRGSWEFVLREGHDFGRANNVEGYLVHAAGESTSSLAFRLDQLAEITRLGDELTLVFEEHDGIAKTARLTPTGLAIELFHVLTYT